MNQNRPGSNIEEEMKRNAAGQAAALGQDPGGADREKLIAGRMREKVTAGLKGDRNEHPDAQWFGRAPLGLFIHWGIASVDGDADLSWSMIANLGHDRKLTPTEYWKLAERFRAEKYNPNEWLRAAKAAGFDYAVLTTKHHDGYTLFPTDTTDMGVRTHLGGRDLVKEFVEACRANGLRVGLYFSGVDWWLDREYRSFNYRSEGGIGNSSLPPILGRPPFDMNHKVYAPPPFPPEIERRNKELCRRQLTELLTRYGKIDVLWFDGGCGSDISIEEIRALQPGIVLNNRGNCRWKKTGGTFPGDYYTVEFGEAPTRPPGWWEQERIWNAPHWGYTRANEEAYSPTATMLALLARSKGWGGAFLANCGPRSDGTLPGPFYRGMQEIEDWMKTFGSSIRGVDPAPEGVEANVPIAARGDSWFLHAIAEDPIEITAGSVIAGVRSVTRMRDGSAVTFSWDGISVLIPFNRIAPDEPHEVLEMLVTPQDPLASPTGRA